MKKILKNIIGLLSVFSVLSNVIFIPFIFAESGNGKTISTYDSGNKSLNKILSRYEKSIRGKNDFSKIGNFLDEIKKLKNGTVSDNFKDNLLQDQSNNYTNINLRNDSIVKSKNTKDQNIIIKKLLDSINKVDKGVYRLFFSTSLSQDEVMGLFSFFDKVDLKLISSKDGKDIYELSFSNKGRLAKFLGKQLLDGQLPTSLFDNIETIKPVAVEGLMSTGTYLSGENLNNLWGMKVIGATEYQYGLSKQTKVKVGVIDTGISSTHNDLRNNIGTGSYAGYNFVSGVPFPEDDHGHGTHVSGIIGATVNGVGVFGVDSNVTIVPLKVLDESGYGSSYSIVDAINYATNNGVKILNMSIGGSGDPSNDIMCNAITNAKNSGVISIVAAGNSNQDVSTSVPAGCSDAITVGAIDSNLNKANFSNYGTKVDVAAPGVSILSTYLGGTYGYMNGTSMATPYITGLGAAILSYRPSTTTEELRAILKDSNNTIAVNSSVNIGRLPSMSKIMNSIGVQDDSQLDNLPPENPVYTPVLSLTGTELSANNYRITATASVTGGTIASYQFYNSGVLLQSGATNTYTINITRNTTITVKVVDNNGQSVTNNIDLVYRTYAPALNLSSTLLSANNYRITATASVTGGTIASYQFYNSGVLLQSGATNTYTINITRNTTITVKVVDNNGQSVTKDISLQYTAGPINNPPSVNISFSKYLSLFNKTTISASDSDGKISNIQIFVNNRHFYSARPNSKNYSLNVISSRFYAYTFKVIATDDKGAKTEKILIVK